MKFIITCFLVFSFWINTFSQNDSIEAVGKSKNRFLEHQIVPVGLIVGGSLLNIGTIKNDIQDFIPNSNTRIDDYLRHIPIGAMYFFDVFGVKHKNTVFNQTKYFLIANGTSSIIVSFLKKSTAIKRPSGGYTSFPSGHTTTAFVGATMLFNEFRETEPVLAYSGFAFATATAVLRLTNDAHWVPDVLVGAGLGILITNLVYYIEPFENWPGNPKKGGVTIIPGINNNGISLTARW